MHEERWEINKHTHTFGFVIIIKWKEIMHEWNSQIAFEKDEMLSEIESKVRSVK